MITSFDTEERKHLAEAPLLRLVNICLKQPLYRLGANSGLILTEIARRLEVPTEAVALVITDPAKKNKTLAPTVIRIWATYDAERVAKLKDIPERTWNEPCLCNQYQVNTKGAAEFFVGIRPLFMKMLVISSGVHRIEMGTAPAENFPPRPGMPRHLKPGPGEAVCE